MNIYALELARIPNASLKVLLRLAQTLRRDTPAEGNDALTSAGAQLDAVIALVRKALIARQVAESPELIATELDFDFAVDGLWVALRRRLELDQAYAHSGLDALPPELAEAGGLEELRAKAKLAQKLWERLFGANGTGFTKSKFIEQAESMSTLLSMLEQEPQLRAELEQVVGARPVAMLYACQKHYEDMVSNRLSRRSPGANLNELRSKLRVAIMAYVNAAMTLVRLDEPDTEAQVLDALRSILTLRNLMTRKLSEDELQAGLDEFVEVEGEAQAAS